MTELDEDEMEMFTCEERRAQRVTKKEGAFVKLERYECAILQQFVCALRRFYFSCQRQLFVESSTYIFCHF